MMKPSSRPGLAAGLAAASLCCGCASLSRPKPPAQPEPLWIAQGTMAILDHGQRVFQGVGVSTGLKKAALCRNAAKTKAEAELFGLFNRQMSLLVHEYQAATTAGDIPPTQHWDPSPEFRAAARSLADKAARTDAWEGKRGEVCAALARLPLKDFKEALPALLDPPTRDQKLWSFLDGRMEPAFDELAGGRAQP